MGFVFEEEVVLEVRFWRVEEAEEAAEEAVALRSSIVIMSGVMMRWEVGCEMCVVVVVWMGWLLLSGWR